MCKWKIRVLSWTHHIFLLIRIFILISYLIAKNLDSSIPVSHWHRLVINLKRVKKHTVLNVKMSKCHCQCFWLRKALSLFLDSARRLVRPCRSSTGVKKGEKYAGKTTRPVDLAYWSVSQKYWCVKNYTFPSKRINWDIIRGIEKYAQLCHTFNQHVRK